MEYNRGLNVNSNKDIVVAQVVDETFWQVAGIERLYPEGETVVTLDIGGPYSTYVKHIATNLEVRIPDSDS